MRVVPGDRTVAPEQRRGIVLLGTEISLFMVAFGLVGPLTFVPLFVSHLSDDPLAVGMVTAAFQIGWIPQLLVAGYVERSERKWPWVRWFGTIERLPVLLLTLCALLAPTVGPPILIVVYLACFAQSLCGGLATTPWMDVIARAVPSWLRGRFMGGFSMAGTLLGAAGAALAAPLLDELPFPYGFAACFGLAFAIFSVSLIPLYLFREPPGPPARPQRPFGEHLRELPEILKHDPPFRRFVLGLSFAALGTMSNGFLVVYAVSELGAPDELALGTRRRCWSPRRRRAWRWGGWRITGASGRWASRWRWRRPARRWWRWPRRAHCGCCRRSCCWGRSSPGACWRE